MKTLRCCVGGLIGSILAGCAYTPVLQSAPAAIGQSGLVYALPKAQFQLDAVRKVVSKSDVDEATKTSESAVAAQAAADKAVVDAKNALAVAQSNVDAVSATDPAATKEKLASDLAIATVVHRARTAEAELAKIRVTEASKRLEQVKANLGKIEQSVVLKPLSPVPDHRHRYAIQHKSSMARDDIIKMTMGSGMLNSSVSESTGQAGALMINLVSSIVGVRTQPKSLTASVDALADSCRAFTFTRTFDPTDTAEVEAMAIALGVESQDSLQLVYEGQEVNVAAPVPPVVAPPLPAPVPKVEAPQATLQGLAYRAPRLASIEVKAKDSANCKSVTKPTYASLAATVPDSTTLYVLPVEAGSFTKSKAEYAFKDGMPISFNVDRPSQAVAIARLPVDIMKAIVEVPASILKLRVDYDSNANALTEAELKSLKVQLDLLKAQQALDEARSAQ